MKPLAPIAAALLALSAPAVHAAPPTPAELAALAAQVRAAECAFAKSMADRDLAAFAQWLPEATLFFGRSGAMHGKATVVEGWRALYAAKEAPFSWAPDTVEVLADGSLALSTGLVRNPQGVATSRYISVWRLEAPGRWRIVVDRGAPLTEAEKAKAQEPDAKPC